MSSLQQANRKPVGGAKEAAPKYVVRTIHASGEPTWDAFVSRSPSGTLFHTTKWLKTTGVPFRIYGCYHNSSLVGGMVVEIIGHETAGRSFFTTSMKEGDVTGSSARHIVGHSANCPYLGVVLPPPSKKYLTTLTQHRNILNALASHLKNDFVSIDLRMSPEVIDMQPFIWAGYHIYLRYTYRIDLSDLDVAWDNMTDKRRNDIRKAERDGITVDDQGSMQDIFSLVEGTFVRREKQKVQFGKLADRRDEMLRSANQGRCFLARDHSGKVVAGIYMVWDERCAYYLMGGYGTTAVHRGAGALAIWEAIRYAGMTLQLQRLDMLAASIEPIERFMRDFGGLLTPVFSVSYQRPSFRRDVKRAFRRLKELISNYAP